ATICYTTDGTTPTANGSGTCTHGTTYSAPVSVSVSETLKAIGSFSGLSDSAVGAAAYVITNGPILGLAPASFGFGNQNINTSSTQHGFTLSNTGNQTATLSSIGFSGTNAADFSQSNNCAATLAANASCTINVTFR